MKKMMFLSHNWYFSVQKALIYYTFNKSHHNSFIMSTPLGGGYIIFALSAVRYPMSVVRCPLSDVRCPMSVVRCPASGVRCPASRMVSARLKKSIRAIVTKFGMQAYWVSSLLGIAFGCCTSFAY